MLLFSKVNKQLNLVDFNIKVHQKYLITYLFKNNNNHENIHIKKEYYRYTQIKIKLSNKEISKIKTEVFGKFRGLSLLECIKK